MSNSALELNKRISSRTIMNSKIHVDITETGQPQFTVTLPKDHQNDVRDKLVKRFFEELHGYPFAGVVTPRGDNSIREIIPLTPGHLFEWLERYGRQHVSCEEYEDKLIEAMETLRHIFGCLPPKEG